MKNFKEGQIVKYSGKSLSNGYIKTGDSVIFIQKSIDGKCFISGENGINSYAKIDIKDICDA